MSARTRSASRVRPITAALSAAAALVVVLASSTSAQAAGCAGAMCGGVTASAHTALPVKYTTQWSSSPAVSGTLNAGQSAGGWWSGVDVDGFYVPTYCYASVSGWSSSSAGAGWHKISTNEQVTVNIQCA